MDRFYLAILRSTHESGVDTPGQQLFNAVDGMIDDPGQHFA
jgi:hypothetical protein